MARGPTRRAYRGIVALINYLSGCKIAGGYALTPAEFRVVYDGEYLTIAVVYVSRRRLVPRRIVMAAGKRSVAEEIAEKTLATELYYVVPRDAECPEGYERLRTVHGKVCNMCVKRMR